MSFRIGSLAQELSRQLTSQNPPEGDASADGSTSDVPSETAPMAEAPAETTPAQPVEESAKAKKKMNFKSVDAYTLKLDGGFGWRNFQNGQKLDHGGGMFRLAAGLRVPVGKRLTISPRLAYEFQGLKKDLGAGMVSRAKAHMVGLELDVGIAVHPKWFSLHPFLGIGAAIYRAPGNTAGTVGAEFNKNPLLFPLRDSGARIDLGLQLCTWGDAVCLGAKFTGDMGINPTLDVVDGPEGGNPPMGLSPMGAGVSVGVDVLRIVSNVRNKKKPEARSPGVDASASEPTAEVPAEEVPPPPAETEPQPTPPDLPKVTVAEFEAKLEEVKNLRNHVEGNLKLAQAELEKIQGSKHKKPDKKISAESAIAFFRSSREKTQSAEVILAGLSDAYGKMNNPEEDARALAILTEVEGIYKEMAAKTVEGHGVAEKAAKAYDKRRGSLEAVEFSDPKPEYPILKPE